MTNQEAYEKVREACIRANSEIVELKFGCKVRLKERYVPDVLVGIQAFDTFNEVTIAHFRDGYHGKITMRMTSQEVGEMIILGRDIRLADLLLMFKSLFDVGNDNPILQWNNIDASYDTVRIVTLNNEIKAHWNLEYDSLEWHRDNQPETVQALAEIIG